jgi:hypothetical protein
MSLHAAPRFTASLTVQRQARIVYQHLAVAMGYFFQ